MVLLNRLWWFWFTYSKLNLWYFQKLYHPYVILFAWLLNSEFSIKVLKIHLWIMKSLKFNIKLLFVNWIEKISLDWSDCLNFKIKEIAHQFALPYLVLFFQISLLESLLTLLFHFYFEYISFCLNFV